MHTTTPGTGAPGPASPPFTTREIEAVLRTVEIPGAGPLIVTLTGEPGELEAYPERQDEETWREHGAEIVLTATAIGLRQAASLLDGVAGYALILPVYGTAWAVDRTGARHTIAMPGPHAKDTAGTSVTAPVFRGLAAMAGAIPVTRPLPASETRPARLLMVGGDEALRADIAELAPPGELFVAEPGTPAAEQWGTADVVLVCHDAVDGFPASPKPGPGSSRRC
ncbi:MAG: hypothetical protein QOJ50_2384 [Cryptosporangiaceae bacterium]|jgi:hypothetical protein|nr:hypothetical protein [Cryptosporangiaceae bacterium]